MYKYLDKLTSHFKNFSVAFNLSLIDFSLKNNNLLIQEQFGSHYLGNTYSISSPFTNRQYWNKLETWLRTSTSDQFLSSCQASTYIPLETSLAFAFLRGTSVHSGEGNRHTSLQIRSTFTAGDFPFREVVNFPVFERTLQFFLALKLLKTLPRCVACPRGI